MVTIIKINNSIHRTITYNENKVKKGVAQCIGAVNYPVDLNKLNAAIKLQRFTKRIALNEIAKQNTVHISINFSPLEDHPREMLLHITNCYMQRIGFDKQPYLVYEHYDSGHQHLHVISTNIQRDGKQINMYNIGVRKSEPARKDIEKLFDLIPAKTQKIATEFTLPPTNVSKVCYGRMESKKAISNIINFVLTQYSCTSFSELNAVLSQYNIIADRCRESSIIFRNGGLLYKILNEEGKPIGMPIKASDIQNKPTLKFLENKFKINTIKSAGQRIRIKKIADLYSIRSVSINQLIKMLQKQGITVVLAKQHHSSNYTITYIDHKTKSVLSDTTFPQESITETIKENNELKQDYKNNKIIRKNYYLNNL
ncbi:relaxase/mobilization nuclease domain-containing protein [Flavobacterium sp. AC]|uniref:Relaxase/mobilization nuclease domain-containing protein n=1 Tax=Flavobacterium azizsancarii TaxID=2961580 RepID=A0ABT4WCT1_9FLAO|nr:relaxase/mobilization nuclease domain-containing protein [Flavobacterium azizsancarii]MDA6070380.1 relaxase/mobilization nuclease domain-containing protein [Flavobacterium azizsancarii]